MRKVAYAFTLTAVLAFVSAVSASAQFAVVDVMGQPILVKSYIDVRGSAYLYDTWMKGSVTINKDVTYVGLELMYDQVTGELIFRSESSEPKVFVQPITEFSVNIIC